MPTFQTAAMLLILWAPWAPDAHRIDLAFKDGREIKDWMLIPGPNAMDWAEGVNLPAVPIVMPVEFAIRRSDALPNYKIRFYGFWSVGLLCWYMVGRFADDLARWRRDHALPRKRAADLTFALLAVPSSILLAGVFTIGDAHAPVLAAWGAIWVVITGAALLFRLAQVIQQRRRVSFS